MSTINYIKDGVKVPIPVIKGDKGDNGDVCQSGENDKGKWVKLTDGTMICWNNSYSSTTNSAGAFEVHFPAAFTDTPAVTVNVIASETSHQYNNIASVNSSYVTVYYMSDGTAFANKTATASYIAIGKWK